MIIIRRIRVKGENDKNKKKHLRNILRCDKKKSMNCKITLLRSFLTVFETINPHYLFRLI